MLRGGRVGACSDICTSLPRDVRTTIIAGSCCAFVADKRANLLETGCTEALVRDKCLQWQLNVAWKAVAVVSALTLAAPFWKSDTLRQTRPSAACVEGHLGIERKNGSDGSSPVETMRLRELHAFLKTVRLSGCALEEAAALPQVRTTLPPAVSARIGRASWS